MGLTDREKKIIEEMEAALTAEDPRLVATMERRRPSLVLNIIAILLGISLLLAGVISKLAILGIAGFLVSLAGAATIRIGKVDLKSGGLNAAKANRIQDRWDRRNQ